MKKILASLLVLAMCAPAMAATVGIVDNGNLTATITVTAEGTDNIVGLGLDVDFTPTTTGNVTAATVDTATFNIYPDAAYTLETTTPGSYTYGAGTPIADQAVAGEVAISNSFAISVGALNGETTAGATGAASVVITVTVDAAGELCVKENATRGGIVLTTGAGEDISNGTAGVVCEPIGPGGPSNCYTEGGLNPGDPAYDLWASVGEPECWCFTRQCHGDADNVQQPAGKGGVPPAHWVGSPDLGILAAGWQKPDTDPAFATFICADFDHVQQPAGKGGVPPAHRVGSPDLGILSNAWQDDSKAPADCVPGTR